METPSRRSLEREASSCFYDTNEDSMRTRACAFALLVTLSPAIFPAGTAFADDALTEMARQRFQEGVTFFDQKKYEQARAAFLQAYALKRHPAVLLNLAQSELRANRPADAARNFARYLEQNPDSTSLERQEAERGLAEARAKAGRVRIVVNAEGADIFVNDELVGKAPLSEPVDIAVGEHRVEARLGAETATASVKATAGQIVETNLVLGAATGGTATPVPGGGTEPQTPAFTTMGPESSFHGMPPPGADSGLHFSTTHRKPFIPWVLSEPVAWATLGVTAVGAGVGIFGVVSANNAATRADNLTLQIREEWSRTPDDQERRPDGRVCGGATAFEKYADACGSLQNALDDERSGKTVAIVGFVAAGVGAAGTAVAYLLTSKESTQPAATVTPIYGPDLAGISFQGRF